jgi:hypothetical protein
MHSLTFMDGLLFGIGLVVAGVIKDVVAAFIAQVLS